MRRVKLSVRPAVAGLGLVGVVWVAACGSTSKDEPGTPAGGDTTGATGGSHAGSKATAGSGGQPLALAGDGGGGDTGGTSPTAGEDGGGKGGTAGVGGGTGGSAGKAGGGGTGGGTVYVGCTSPLEEKVGDLCVAKLVPVTGGYSIDATEVTRGQYASWLATKPGAPQDARCAAATSHAPDPKCVVSMNDAADTEHLPQGCVTWCDAISYCEAVGKRLCGKIGGGPTPFDKWADETQSQWQNACSSGGKHIYPYGDVRDGNACNGYDAPPPGLNVAPVATFTKCTSTEAGFTGVFDLSGNAKEFEDSCQTFDFVACRLRGGSVVGMLECAEDGVTGINDTAEDWGFRCCKD